MKHKRHLKRLKLDMQIALKNEGFSKRSVYYFKRNYSADVKLICIKCGEHYGWSSSRVNPKKENMICFECWEKENPELVSDERGD